MGSDAKDAASAAKAAAIDTRLASLERELDKVRTLYEQHFAGVIKKEPINEHQNLKLQFHSINNSDLKTTASRFRYQSIHNRYLQLSQLWAKILRQIEEGTYKRDLFLLEKKHRAEEDQQKKTQAPAGEEKKLKLVKKPGLEAEIGKLYDKMKDLVGQTQKLPDREKFVTAIQDQLKKQREKNPGTAFEIKLEKETTGKYQVKIKMKKT